jgi:hypothetical protein
VFWRRAASQATPCWANAREVSCRLDFVALRGVSELAVIGRASFLVPFPRAIQTCAHALHARGYAVVYSFMCFQNTPLLALFPLFARRAREAEPPQLTAHPRPAKAFSSVQEAPHQTPCFGKGYTRASAATQAASRYRPAPGGGEGCEIDRRPGRGRAARRPGTGASQLIGAGQWDVVWSMRRRSRPSGSPTFRGGASVLGVRSTIATGADGVG